MDTRFTPGPWFINTAGSAKKGQPFRITEIYVYAPHVQDDTAICADIIDPLTQEPSEANARLIAAAPDLLAALVALDECYCAAGPHLTKDERHQHRLTLIAARAAIAKATGAA